MKGKDLIELGYKPSKWFGEALNKINAENISGEVLIEYLNDISKPLPVPETIGLHVEPIEYHKNIVAENLIEQSNIDKVFDVMNDIMRTPTVVGGAIMPDACPTGGKEIPVGTIIKTINAIHPSWHSSDMCCSVYCTDFGNASPKDVLDAANSITHFGQGGRPGYGDFGHILTDNKELYNRLMDNYYTKDYIEKACRHLGTQGDGNHFLFVGISEETGRTMMVTHHGSRGFGVSVYKKGMATAEKYRKILSPDTLKSNAWIPYNEIEGVLYWDAIQIVRDWTKLNHSTIHNKVLNKLKMYGTSFWNEHNSVFKDGDEFYHAKGATPLDDKFVPDSTDGLRLIPLNMSQPILVVKGTTTENNIGFAPHGAGRNVSRNEHIKNQTKSTEEIFVNETKNLDVRFFSGKIDISELPSAYKNADNVQSQIDKFGLGEVVDRIMPFGCIMAGSIDKSWKK